MEIQSKLPTVGTTIFSVMSQLASKHNAINLSQGFPDFPIDPSLASYVKTALDKNHVQYAPMPGRADLRIAIAHQLKQKHNITVNPDIEITVTAGATQAIYAAISAIVHTGDEVVLFDPAYDCYAPAVVLNGGTPVHLNLKHPNYIIDWDEVNRAVNENTRVIIINNPHNPTGSVWTKADTENLKSCLKAFPKLIVLSDEVYEHIQFTGEHQSVLKDDFLRKRSVATYSFGKTLHATGWKLGYCVAPVELSAEIQKVHQYMVFCANNTMQYAVQQYLTNDFQAKEIAKMYQKKRDLFLDKMQHSRFKTLACDGTYFCLLDYSAISDLPDVEFTKWLTIQHGVATIPVSVFNQNKADRNVIRVCFAKQDETLIKAAEKLCSI